MSGVVSACQKSDAKCAFGPVIRLGCGCGWRIESLGNLNYWTPDRKGKYRGRREARRYAGTVDALTMTGPVVLDNSDDRIRLK